RLREASGPFRKMRLRYRMAYWYRMQDGVRPQMNFRDGKTKKEEYNENLHKKLGPLGHHATGRVFGLRADRRPNGNGQCHYCRATRYHGHTHTGRRKKLKQSRTGQPEPRTFVVELRDRCDATENRYSAAGYHRRE